ncbi:MAG: hypothetical protein QM372_08590 [Bacillota bacterium]|jgi:hypothetical protein|nr:hypothetical protein [Bacillota bacterium]
MVGKTLLRNSLFALTVFLVIAVLVQTNLEFAQPVTEYVSFVVSTNFSVRPILNMAGFTERWDALDFGSLLEGWSEATFGW